MLCLSIPFIVCCTCISCSSVAGLTVEEAERVDKETEDCNQEIFPIIQDLRNVLRNNGVYKSNT